MGYKKEFVLYFICIFLALSLVLQVYSDNGEYEVGKEDFDWEDETSTQQDYETAIQKDPSSITPEDMANNPQITERHWDKFSDDQKYDLYEDHRDKFEGKFS